MGAIWTAILDNNPIYQRRIRGAESNKEYMYGVFGNEAWLGDGGDDTAVATAVAGYNALRAYGWGDKKLVAFMGAGYNRLTYESNYNRSNYVAMAGNVGVGYNEFVLNGSQRGVITGTTWLGANNVRANDNRDLTVTLVNGIGANVVYVSGTRDWGTNVITSANVLGVNVQTQENASGTTVMTAANAIGVNIQTRTDGDGTTVMTAGNKYGANAQTRTNGSGTTVMTAGNQGGANAQTRTNGSGTTVMTAGNQGGVNIQTRTNGGDTTIMTAGNQWGGNVQTQVNGDGTTVMTSGNQYGANAQTRTNGSGTTVMTAGNQGGANAQTRTNGSGTTVMTAGNQGGVNIQTRTNGGDTTIMTAGNQWGGNVQTQVNGDGTTVMTSGNQYGANAQTRTNGSGTTVMTAGNQGGVNIQTRTNGDGTTVMTSGNQYGANAQTRTNGSGTTVMTAGNQGGVNIQTRTNGGDTTIMTAGNQWGGNVQTQVNGDGTTVMTSGNQYGANAQTRTNGSGTTVMTAGNQWGGNVQTQVNGDGTTVMTSGNQYGANAQTRTNGSGTTVMTAGNKYGANIQTVILRDGAINNIAVMSALNFRGANLMSATVTIKDKKDEIGSQLYQFSVIRDDGVSIISNFKSYSNDVIVALNLDYIKNWRKNLPEYLSREGSEDQSTKQINSFKNKFLGPLGNQPWKVAGMELKKSLTFLETTILDAGKSLLRSNFILGGYGRDVIVGLAESNYVFSDKISDVLDFNIRALQGGATLQAYTSTQAASDYFGELSNYVKIMDFAPYLVVTKFSGSLSEIVGVENLEDSEVDDLHLTKGYDYVTMARKIFLSKVSVRIEQGTTSSTYLNIAVDAMRASGDKRNRSAFSSVGRLAASLTLDPIQIDSNIAGMGGEGFWTNLGANIVNIGVLPIISLKYDDINTDAFRASAEALGNSFKEICVTPIMKERDSDTVFLMGEVNVLFSGAGGDLNVLLGKYNFVFSGAGDDMVFAFGQYNQVYGGKGSDFLFAYGNDSVIYGEDDGDILIGAGNMTILDGGAGDDLLIAVGLKNTLIGGAGNDILIGLGQMNSFHSGSGENLIIGAGLKNTYILSGGNDFMINFGAQNIVYSFGFSSINVQAGDNAIYYGASGRSLFLANDNSRNIKDAVYFGGAGSEFYELSGTRTSVNTGEGGDILSITENTAQVHVRDLNSSDCVVIGKGMLQSIAFVENYSHLYVYFVDYNNKLGFVVFDDWFSKVEYRANIFIDAQVDDAGHISGYKITPDMIKSLSSVKDYAQIDAIAIGGKMPDGFGRSINDLKLKSSLTESAADLYGMDTSLISQSMNPNLGSPSKMMANADDFVQSLASNADLNSVNVAMMALGKFSKFGEQMHVVA